MSLIHFVQSICHKQHVCGTYACASQSWAKKSSETIKIMFVFVNYVLICRLKSL